MKTDKENPLLCDIENSTCVRTVTDNTPYQTTNLHPYTDSSLRVIYFTDPICSSCWGIEPQLRKLKLTYGQHIHIEYHMGGLLPDWNYSGGGINQPSDVAIHWDEASYHYDMPIDGDLWLADPLMSSYPPSVAFKAAQLQNEWKAIRFLRKMREMVFMQKKNIAKWDYIAEAAIATDIDVQLMEKAMQDDAQKNFEQDLLLSRQYGVRGFPTLFFLSPQGNMEVVYGARSYQDYRSMVQKLAPNLQEIAYEKNWKALFSQFSTLTIREYATLSEISRKEAEKVLLTLLQGGHLEKESCKNGVLYKLNDIVF